MNPTDAAFATATVTELAGVLAADIPPGVGFVVALFGAEGPTWMTYGANVSSASLPGVLRELADRIGSGRCSARVILASPPPPPPPPPGPGADLQRHVDGCDQCQEAHEKEAMCGQGRALYGVILAAYAAGRAG